MRYKKTIKLAKDYKNKELIVASIFCEYNFDKLFIEICPINNCNLYTHILLFNTKNAKLYEKNNNIVTVPWDFGLCEIALVNINDRNIVASTMETNSIDNFDEIFKNAFVEYLSKKKVFVGCNYARAEEETPLRTTGIQMTFDDKIYNLDGKCYLDGDRISRLLHMGQAENFLMKKFANSIWRKICVSGNFYVCGILYNDNVPRYVGVGVPVITRNSISENLKKFTDFFPARENNPMGFGYYLGFKDIKSGENVKLSI